MWLRINITYDRPRDASTSEAEGLQTNHNNEIFHAKPTPTVTATPSPPTTSTYYFIDDL